MNRILLGAIAGVIGTYTMTLAKILLFAGLPSRERYPLPPREITQDVAERLAGRPLHNERSLFTGTLAAHFGFGALCGMLLTGLNLHRRRPVLSGVGFGLSVWVVSYLGWIPASGILKIASRQPLGRNLLMIAVHAVWGATAGHAAATLMRSERVYGSDRRSALKDRA
jgi:hypothetical protein